jgi:hypothetical protein
MEGLPDLAERPSNTFIARQVGAARQTISSYMKADTDDPSEWLNGYDEEIDKRLVELFVGALGSVELPDDKNGDEHSMFQEKQLTLRPWTEETAPATMVAV